MGIEEIYEKTKMACLIILLFILVEQVIQAFFFGGNLSVYKWKPYHNHYYSISYPRTPNKKIYKNNDIERITLSYCDLFKHAFFSSSFTKTSNNMNELTKMPINKPEKWLNRLHGREWKVTINKIIRYKHYNKDGFSVRDVIYDSTFQDQNTKLNVIHFTLHSIYYVKPHLAITTTASATPSTFQKNQGLLNRFLTSFSLTSEQSQAAR